MRPAGKSAVLIRGSGLSKIPHVYGQLMCWYFLASSTLNMFTHFEQLGYLDFYTLIKLSVILPHGVWKLSGTSKKMFNVSQVKSIYTKTRYR
jgi:hypothetical protein